MKTIEALKARIDMLESGALTPEERNELNELRAELRTKKAAATAPPAPASPSPAKPAEEKPWYMP